MKKFILCLVVVIGMLALHPQVLSQNIVEFDGQNLTLPPLKLQMKDWERLVEKVPRWSFPEPSGAEVRRIAGKLEAHVLDFLEGYPWRPFHHTLGISGFETLYGHPDEMYYALALALPYLDKKTAGRVREFGRNQMRAGVLPFSGQGPLPQGRMREAYEVPEIYRLQKAAQSKSLFGIYSLWAWCRAAGEEETARRLWPQVKEIAAPWLAEKYTFDPLRSDYTNDEAELLNGNLAGLLGYVRLARLNGDVTAELAARERGLQLYQWRVDLERLNPKILEKSTRSASKSLHNFKLARYCCLVPEVAEALREHASPVAARRLEAFRRERPGWWMALGDRMVGGENYTNPPHFSRALFGSAAIIEAVPPELLLQWVDVPWCYGDFYFMEKCALALWCSAGRPLQKN